MLSLELLGANNTEAANVKYYNFNYLSVKVLKNFIYTISELVS